MAGMEAKGWFRLYRKLTASELWLRERFTRGQAWVDLLAMAAHEPSVVRVRDAEVDCARGQIATSDNLLSERWQWSRGTTRRFLGELQKHGRIVQERSHLSTVITIVNYDLYQGDGTTEGPPGDTSDGTSDGTTHADSPPTPPSFKKRKEGKKGNPPLPPLVPELPASCRTPELQAVLADWIAYKAERREAYKARGLKQLVGRIASVAAIHGPEAVVSRMQRAMASNYQGWDFPERQDNGRQRTFSGGQQYIAGSETRPPGAF